MAYDNSLTTSVQSHISTVLAKKVMDASTARQIGSTARQIREYLTDQTTLSTPDFVIRRYIQANHPGMLTEYGPLPDLIAGRKNVPWPEKVIASLAAKLEALSKEQDAAISAAEWTRYLGRSIPNNREKVFRMAFTLKMDVDQTLELLLAFSMEPYSVRQPLDLICMFCQTVPGTYTWAQARQMHKEFMDRRTHKAGGTAKPTLGMTEKVEMKLYDIFDQKLQGANAQKELVDYMVEHSGEFISFLDKEDEVFLPGYSLHRDAQFRRLMEYLAVVYPSLINLKKKKDGEGDERKVDPKQWENRTEYVIDKKTRVLSLPTLVRAMFWASGWSDLDWKENAPKGSFDDNMRKFCKNYKQHIDKVNRLLNGGRNIAFFDRRDALLFIFFFLSGYSKLLSYNDDDADLKIVRLREMSESGDRFDRVMGQVMDKLDELGNDYENAKRHFQGLCQCFNLILTRMGHTNLYLPAQFDRFVLLALLAEEPEELAGLVMSEAEWEEYDRPFPKQPEKS